MINRKQLGARIREARQRRGMSQQELAETVGVSDKTISAYEVGRVDPPLEALEKLSQATAHPVGFFIGDVQSNIGAQLDRIAHELSEIRETLKGTQESTVPVSSNAQISQTQASHSPEDQSLV